MWTKFDVVTGIGICFVVCISLKDDEQVSTALGYIVHILLLTSKYLQVCTYLICE
jgi:hypothetical protein